MRVYFYDDRNRYIGNRELEDNEIQPEKTTLNPVELHDGEEAYLVGGEWVVSKIPEETCEEITE
jgi:hypothetical protein